MTMLLGFFLIVLGVFFHNPQAGIGRMLLDTGKVIIVVLGSVMGVGFGMALFQVANISSLIICSGVITSFFVWHFLRSSHAPLI